MATTGERLEAVRRGWTPGRVVTVVVVLALVLFWIWIFTGGPSRKNPDYLGDRAWTTRAQRTCQETVRQLGHLPRAIGASSAANRADVLDRATDELDAMVRRLDQPPPDDATDARVTRQWLADWRSYLGDRRDYAIALRRDPGARFLVDEKFHDPIDTVIETFATVNAMPACATPGDVG